MTLVDWTGADPGVIAGLYAEEAAHWRHAFRWETSGQWQEVETARTMLGLPGLLARDGQGRARGWLYYLRDAAGVQLGGLTASDEDATAVLVDGLTAREGVRRLSAFMPERAPGVVAALERTGWTVTPHAYLMRTVSEVSGPDAASPRVRPWCAADAEAAAVVLREAYDPAEGALFAPDGSLEQWRAYVRGLLEQIGCGRFLPHASAMALAGRAAEEPVGVVLTTAIDARTAHIAQIGVSPHAQQQGGGQRLLRHAMRQAAAHGCSAVTLVVSTANARAGRFYREAGFAVRGTFLQAERLAAAHPCGPHRPHRTVSPCG